MENNNKPPPWVMEVTGPLFGRYLGELLAVAGVPSNVHGVLILGVPRGDVDDTMDIVIVSKDYSRETARVLVEAAMQFAALHPTGDVLNDKVITDFAHRDGVTVQHVDNDPTTRPRGEG